jgi:hypothetical protein
MNKQGKKGVMILFAIFFFSMLFPASGQTTYFEQNSPAYDILERLEIKSGNTRNDIFLEIKPVRRDAVSQYFKGLDSGMLKSKADKYWMSFVKNDNLPYGDSSEKENSRYPVLKSFYKNKANLYQVDLPYLHVYINPVFDFEGGKEQGYNKTLFRNTRGAELRGDIDGKVGFYSYFTDNQVVYPKFVHNNIKGTRAIPGEGYYKNFNDSGSNAYDFFQARGYITYSPTDHIHLQFGNDRNVLGSGYRSLILSDNAKEYLFFKINTQVWRFNYENLFCQFTDFQPTLLKPYPRKYGAIHTLSYNATRWWNIAITESIIFYDNKNTGRGYDLNYLNPIIFYRTVEHYLGSPDNALIGMNNTFLVHKHFKIYQQLLFDELKVHQLVNGRNWWGNKYGLQLGAKYIDVFGLPNIDWQIEGNYVRPYTYTSDTSGKNYAQFRQALAHPVGGNFEELINILRINIFGPLDIRIKYFYIRQGHDIGNIDYGSNILIPYTYAEKYRPYGNTMLQGDLVTTKIAEVQASYMIRHNLFFDLSWMYRTEQDVSHSINYKDNFINAGLRLNFIKQNYEF